MNDATPELENVYQISPWCKSLGQIAFEAYQRGNGSEASWDLMSDKCHGAWHCAAQAVVAAVEDADLSLDAIPTAPASAPNSRSADELR